MRRCYSSPRSAADAGVNAGQETPLPPWRDAGDVGDDAPEWPLRELLGFRRLRSVQPGQSVHLSVLSWQVANADDLRLASTRPE